jgi:alkylation response protein AidB-like acyl-CoA dehydrogenase
MHIELAPEQIAFRAEVCEFIETCCPADVRDKLRRHQSLGRDDYLRWQRILFDHGWGAPYWPKEHGGTGWDHTQLHIFEQACAELCAPHLVVFGHRMLAPVLLAFGNDEQKARFLPRIARGEDFWCQGYSEPGSGSDLVSLRTRAERTATGYVVNGQKMWTTEAHLADWIFCLVRTQSEGKPHQGISFLLINMRSPGVTVRPIKMLDGGYEVNEVFFDNVEVPLEQLVGEENKGWNYAKYLLTHERTALNLASVCKRWLNDLKHLASGSLMQDARFRDRLAQLEIELLAHEVTLLRTLSTMAKAGQPGPEASILKVRGTEIAQAITELAMRAVGHESMAVQGESDDEAWSATYFNMRKLSIFGGTNEIQRNIIAQQVLGLH